MKKRKYAIVDIETTGGMYLRDKIIEIAIIITDGSQILSEFQSLVHPERTISPHITGITGIDDSMVREAPKFYEIAKEVVEILDGAIFVAHNVNFDYNFIKEEFKSLGYAFNKKRLCTVKLTRSVVPGINSYGLDALIQHFDIDVAHRHRAYDDTLATYKIFRYIYEDLIDDFHLEKMINLGLDASVLPKGMDMEEVHAAPETAGVYYLSNKHDRVLYVGKAKNIKKRIFQHFRKISVKANNIHNYVDKLHFEETGNELIALLLELYEIKRHQPEFNKSMKRRNFTYALYFNRNYNSKKHALIVNKNNKANDFKYEKIKLFSSKAAADGFCQYLISEEEVCMSLFKSRSRAFVCNCAENCGNFLPDQAGQIDQVITACKNEFDVDFIMILPGRNDEELSFVMVYNNRFWGFGYVPKEEVITSREQWNDFISHQFWYPEANGIVKQYYSKHNSKIIKI